MANQTVCLHGSDDDLKNLAQWPYSILPVCGQQHLVSQRFGFSFWCSPLFEQKTGQNGKGLTNFFKKS